MHTFDFKGSDWGWSQMLPVTEITQESGFLREDGVLVVQVDILLPTPTGGSYPATLLPGDAGGLEVSSDLLALLATPGTTSDFTIIATVSVPASETGVKPGTAQEQQEQQQPGAGPSSKQQQDGGSASGEASGSTTGGDSTTRRFEVHRVILAARCPYFRTLFESGLADASTRELTLPDTDPDALAVLLRFVYGGGLVLGSREQARSSLALADKLLLPAAAAALRKHLASTTSAASVIADLLCAADMVVGHEELLDKLLEVYPSFAVDVDKEELEQLAAQRPGLMVQLHTALCRGATQS
jgi:hypothetical protein